MADGSEDYNMLGSTPKEEEKINPDMRER